MSPLPYLISLASDLLPRKTHHHTSSSSSSSSSGSGSSTHLSVGAIVGIVVGVFVLSFLGILIYQVVRAKKRGEVPLRWGKILLKSCACAACGAIIAMLCIATEEKAQDDYDKFEQIMDNMGGDSGGGDAGTAGDVKPETNTTTTHTGGGGGFFAFIGPMFSGARRTNMSGNSGRKSRFGALASLFGKKTTNAYSSSSLLGVPGKTGTIVSAQPVSQGDMQYQQQPYQQPYPQGPYQQGSYQQPYQQGVPMQPMQPMPTYQGPGPQTSPYANPMQPQGMPMQMGPPQVNITNTQYPSAFSQPPMQQPAGYKSRPGSSSSSFSDVDVNSDNKNNNQPPRKQKQQHGQQDNQQYPADMPPPGPPPPGSQVYPGYTQPTGPVSEQEMYTPPVGPPPNQFSGGYPQPYGAPSNQFSGGYPPPNGPPAGYPQTHPAPRSGPIAQGAHPEQSAVPQGPPPADQS
jgi:hypothetical protein